MIGLFFSELILYVVAILLGFVIGWRLRAHVGSMMVRAAEDDVTQLRVALSEAQVRRSAPSL